MEYISVINELLELEFNEDFINSIFKILQKIINFEYGHIIFNSSKYAYGEKHSNNCIKSDLKIKNTKFGEIRLYNSVFKPDSQNLLMQFAAIISNIIKNNEISKISKMQNRYFREGLLKAKETEEIKSNFISHISHELRTPLNSILGYSDLLGLAGDLNNKQKEFINDIKVSGINLLNMINEILDMTKLESGIINVTNREFSISQIIDETENIIKPLLINKDLEFIKNITDFKINTDYQKLQQILLNLLSNAIKFTPQNGKIIITAKNNHGCLISVKDTGIGIAEENQNKIFEKFEQINPNDKNSTGLGLCITKELVKLLNGTIDLKSKINEGAEFIVKF